MAYSLIKWRRDTELQLAIPHITVTARVDEDVVRVSGDATANLYINSEVTGICEVQRNGDPDHIGGAANCIAVLTHEGALLIWLAACSDTACGGPQWEFVPNAKLGSIYTEIFAGTDCYPPLHSVLPVLYNPELAETVAASLRRAPDGADRENIMAVSCDGIVAVLVHAPEQVHTSGTGSSMLRFYSAYRELWFTRISSSAQIMYWQGNTLRVYCGEHTVDFG